MPDVCYCKLEYGSVAVDDTLYCRHAMTIVEPELFVGRSSRNMGTMPAEFVEFME